MELIILLLIVVLAGFLMRGLFDTKWRESSQEKIDGIKHERIFWGLMRGAYEVEHNVNDIYKLYVISLIKELTVGDIMMKGTSFPSYEEESDPYSLDRTVIKKKYSWIKNINRLNDSIEKEGKFIENSLGKMNLTFTDKEVRDELKLAKKQLHTIADPEQYDRLVSFFAQLIEDKMTGVGILLSMRKLEENMSKFEYDHTGNVRVDAFGPLVIAHMEINGIISKLLCKKIEDSEAAKKLENSLKKWMQLHMLRFCIVDHSVWQVDTNVLERAFWRVVKSVFL